MVEFRYETNATAEENAHDILDHYVVEDDNARLEASGGRIEKALRDNKGCLWDVEVLYGFNRIEITAQVTYDDVDEYEYSASDVMNPSQFEDWCEEHGMEVVSA